MNGMRHWFPDALVSREIELDIPVRHDTRLLRVLRDVDEHGSGPAARRKKAEPKTESDAPEGEPKPKRTPRPKAEKPATEGDEAPKPKRRTTKKTEEGE